MFKNHKNHYAWQNPVLLINSLFPYSLKAHTMMQTTFYSKEKQKSFFFPSSPTSFGVHSARISVLLLCLLLIFK